VGHLADQGEDLPHGGALADQIAERAGSIHRTPQAPILLLQRAALDGALHGQQHDIGLEGLGDVVERARSHRLDGGVDGAEGGHQDHGRLAAELAQLSHQLDPGAGPAR
jgi:hypothetical protein